MVKRRYARKKRGYKKKRYMRKRMSRFKKTSYDGVYYAKGHYVYELRHDTLLDQASLNIMWGQAGGSTARSIYIDDCTEIANLRSIFQEWRLKGIKIRIIPISNVTGSIGSGLFECNIASFTKDAPTETNTVASMAQQVDYKTYPMTRPINKYINVGKYYAKKGEKWLDSDVFYAGGQGTRILVDVIGYTDEYAVAKVDITYYCAFKGYGPTSG